MLQRALGMLLREKQSMVKKVKIKNTFVALVCFLIFFFLNAVLKKVMDAVNMTYLT